MYIGQYHVQKCKRTSWSISSKVMAVTTGAAAAATFCRNDNAYRSLIRVVCKLACGTTERSSKQQQQNRVGKNPRSLCVRSIIIISLPWWSRSVRYHIIIHNNTIIANKSIVHLARFDFKGTFLQKSRFWFGRTTSVDTRQLRSKSSDDAIPADGVKLTTRL